MPILTACCCFETLKTGAKASAVFTLITGFINFILDILSIQIITHYKTYSEPQEQYLYLPPGILTFAWIELILSLLMMGIGCTLYIGINLDYEGKKFIFGWLIFMTVDRIYDFFIGVYILSWIGGHRIRDVLYVCPGSIPVTVYWVVDSFIRISAIICVVSYWQELKDDLFGKERRLKHYSKLANLRHAALSGNATPYKSYYASKSLLGLDSQSLLLDQSR